MILRIILGSGKAMWWKLQRPRNGSERSFLALEVMTITGRNVAEMVYDTEKRKDLPRTVGGGWMSNEEELKILGPDPYSEKTEAHPNIGFRVVFSYMNQ